MVESPAERRAHERIGAFGHHKTTWITTAAIVLLLFGCVLVCLHWCFKMQGTCKRGLEYSTLISSGGTHAHTCVHTRSPVRDSDNAKTLKIGF